MIDIQQFEGHVMNGDYQVWSWSKDAMKRMESVGQYHSTAALLNAAPDLLAEVKRLRKGIEQAVKLLNTDANTTRELLKEMIE